MELVAAALDGLVEDLLGLALAAGSAITFAHPPPVVHRPGGRWWRCNGRFGGVRILNNNNNTMVKLRPHKLNYTSFSSYETTQYRYEFKAETNFNILKGLSREMEGGMKVVINPCLPFSLEMEPG